MNLKTLERLEGLSQLDVAPAGAGTRVLAGWRDKPRRSWITSLLRAVLSLVGFKRANSDLVKGWPIALDHIARSLRSGVTLAEAITSLPQSLPPVLERHLKNVRAGLNSGVTLAQGLEALADELEGQESQIAIAALHLCAQDSSIGAQPIDGAAKTLRDCAELDAEVSALISQSSLSMLVLTLLPFAGLLMGVLAGSSQSEFLLSERLGQLLLIAAVVLDVFGWFWMRHIIKTTLR